MRRVWLGALVGAGLWAGCVCAQTPASQQNESQWKQTPEGRPAVPSTPMNCTGTATRGDDGKVTTTSNCPAAQDQPVPSSAAQQFPYPGDTSSAPQQTAPQAPAPGQTEVPPNPAQQFPYPGDNTSGGSSSGLKDAGSSGTSTSGSSSSNSSSGYSSSSSSNAGAANGGTGAAPVPISPRRLPGAPRQTPSQREREDLQVAGFYQNDGDYRGAYLRAQDAVSIAGDDADAHLALAEAARKLGKLDEAEQNYKRCLALDPVPKTRKAAERALKEMTGGD